MTPTQSSILPMYAASSNSQSSSSRAKICPIFGFRKLFKKNFLKNFFRLIIILLGYLIIISVNLFLTSRTNVKLNANKLFDTNSIVDAEK